MTKRMLVDATHAEETRVAVIDGKKLVEFDYESQFRKPLKGNVFLAKVTRVEPSLQAAFVNFGGNRHGFLPFSEIHPDYFRIPIADREALLAEQEEALKEHDAEEEGADLSEGSDEDSEDDDIEEVEELGGEDVVSSDDNGDVEQDEAGKKNSDEQGDAGPNAEESDAETDEESDDEGDDSEEERGQNRGQRGGRRRYNARGRRGGGRRRMAKGGRRVETVGGDEVDEGSRFRFNLRRKYKIQEVIKRGQIMLVQASKEERGNKGAAVTTYLSLPGRYCVLMPNSPRAGGVSRKIADYKERTKMRDILKELEIPKGMSVIVRTAGMQRTKTEIKRDLDYLMRLWNTIRELTLKSSAPALIYEEANLIKRSVRDLYTRDIEEVVVAGEEGYKTAKDFMKMMIPSHAKRVKTYKEGQVPLFHKYKIEEQIAEIGEAQVTLPSGGYLVIHPTEALVSVDVNSGRATKERHIEETALNTNLEAAEEVARQLRLRDLGGLVVIDFIDMEDRRNNGKVERKMREALSTDRARVQMSRISLFGLMELSRQRMNPSLAESQFEICPHCLGFGRVRTPDGTSIMVLRGLEEEGIRKRAAQVIVHVTADVALYLLNNKRQNIAEIEGRYGMQILVRVDEEIGISDHRIEVSKPLQSYLHEDGQDDDGSDDDDDRHGPGSRRRGRRGGRNRGRGGYDRYDGDREVDSHESQAADEETQNQDQMESVSAESDDAKDEKPARGRKPFDKPKTTSRSRSRKKPQEDVKEEEALAQADEDMKEEEKPKQGYRKKAEGKEDKAPPKRKSSNRTKKARDEEQSSDGQAAVETEAETEVAVVDEVDVKSKKSLSPSNDDAPELIEDVPKDYENVNEPPKKKKKGWWNKLVD